ncbi:tape measure protein [Lactobacillus sp. ESL0680]|uniref:tape measure protein n=1 Tax=Lactobacillus sp. ESL0680 TaxID=2983210 RepID=UPI0023F86019|nr:tape measure protein [Lactobacillus sp. ESL0680]WEV39284.1 tape measure protein [Lactobacillus sp. ESL0680]
MGVIETTIRLNDAFSGTLRKLESGSSGFDKLKGALNGGNMFGNATKQSNGFFKSMVGAQVVGSTISKGMALAGNGIRGMLQELNQSSIAWQTFEGNMHQIGKTPAQIAKAKASMADYAAKTIYDATDMSSTYSQLASVGVKNTGKLVTGFAGLAASAQDPVQAMKTLSQQGTQMAAKPMVQWQDFRLMLEQAPGGISAVAKAMGMSERQMVAQVQKGTIKTDEFFKAVERAGNNANFTKMATKFKTVGQAIQGIKENLAYQLIKQFQRFSKVGIDALDKVNDKINRFDFNKLGDKAMAVFNKIRSAASNIFKGFNSTGALSAIQGMFQDIGKTIGSLSKKASSGGKGNLFTQIGKIGGGAIRGAANAIDGIARAISKMDPGTLKALGAALVILKTGMKGLVFGALIAGLNKLGKLKPDQIKQVATAIKVLAGAFLAFKIGKGIINTISSVGNAFDKLKGLKNIFGKSKEIKTPKIEAPDINAITKPFEGLSNLASGILKFSVALLAVAAAVWVFAQAAATLNSSGGLTMFLGMIIGISGLMIVASGLGSALEIALPGILGFSAAILLIGAAIAIATPGISALSGLVRSIGSAVTSVINAIAGALPGVVAVINSVASGIKNIISQLGQSISQAVNSIGQNVGRIANTIGKSISGVINSVGRSISNVIKSITGGIKGILEGIADTIKSVGQSAKYAGQGVSLMASGMKELSGIGIGRVGAIFAEIVTGAKKLGDTGSNVSKAGNGVSRFVSGLKLAASALKSLKANSKISISIKKPKTFKLQLPKTKSLHITIAKPKIPTPKAPKIKTLHVKVARPVIPQPRMPKLRNIPAPHVGRPSMVGVVSAVRSGMNQAVSAVRSGGNRMVAAVQSAVSRAAAVARSGAGAMQSAGAMIGAGLAAGIRSEIGAVAAAADALVAQADRAARAKAKIHSPSRLFAEVGSFIGQGMALGMNKTTGLVSAAGAGLIDAANTGSSVGVNYTGSGSITPASLTRSQVFSTRNNSSNSSHAVTIAKGAIVINGSSKPQQTADEIMTAIEKRMVEIDNRRL